MNYQAGVPIKRPVAGVAMGLILEEDKVAILTDILGMEDALGDMDFKVAGDADGITALQMDIKVEGITKETMGRALAQARKGRIHVLNVMKEAMPEYVFCLRALGEGQSGRMKTASYIHAVGWMWFGDT